MEDLLIPFGKVVVSDDEQEVILTGRMDTMYLPPYTYSTIQMKGQVGKQYTVIAKYRDLYASATTTIPPIDYLDSIVIKSDTSDLVTLLAYMTVDTTSEAYYAFFMRKEKTKQFQLCPFGVFNGKDVDEGKVELRIFNALTDTVDNMIRIYTFVKDSTMYELKLARIDYPSYLFWKAYNEHIITRGVIFVPVYKNIPSNVQGGLGYFSGMGSSYYQFNCAKDTTYRYNLSGQ